MDNYVDYPYISVQYHQPQGGPLIQAHPGEWIDLRCAEDVEMKTGEFRLLNLGVSIALPKGYEAIVAPRSSTFKNFGIIQANSIGVIDEAYCGEDDVWLFPAIALRDTTIHAGDRIAQFRILPVQGKVNIGTVDHLSGSNRGGIGSTGTN